MVDLTDPIQASSLAGVVLNYRRRRFGYTTKKRGYRPSTYALRKKLGLRENI